MNEKQALNLLTQVVRAYKGTAEEHELLKSALLVISKLVDKKEVREVKAG